MTGVTAAHRTPCIEQNNMPSEFPGSPLFIKGALVVFEAPVPVPTNIIVFQYNPETMTRKIMFPGGDPAANNKNPSLGQCRIAGDTNKIPQLPIETFSLTVELDATDQLEEKDPVTQALGLQPVLAALELLLYPQSAIVILDKILALFGSAFITPPTSPVVLFVWGPARVVPVLVTSVTVTEQAFDQLLNPIQAKVDLEMRSLTDRELNDAGIVFRVLDIVQLTTKEGFAHLQLGGVTGKELGNAAKVIKGMLPF
jgi:hypothetical protein